MNRKETLSVHDLLRAVCRRLGRKLDHRTLHFPHGIETEIADDSDWHRTRTGYMRYRSAKVVKTGGKRWVVARGEKWGSYPADPYDSDIIAVRIADKEPVDAKLVDEVARTIREGSYFLNSLVVGLADGNLALFQRSRFSGQMQARLRPIAAELIAQSARHDDRYLSLSTLQPIVTSAAQYRPEAVRLLADIITGILAGS